jgi:GTP pyrophosphokinase
MSDDHMYKIKNIEFAPYMQLAFGLIDKPRKCGGNSFRHSLDALNILIDYGYCNPALLKAAIIHDLLEDIPGFDEHRITQLVDGKAVLDLVKQVSRSKGESKEDFLTRIHIYGSVEAKTLKVADRISNMISLGQVNDLSFVVRYINETEKYVFPIAVDVNKHMLQELIDLVGSRRFLIKKFIGGE